MPKFHITVDHLVSHMIEVEADTEKAAEDKALLLIEQGNFNDQQIVDSEESIQVVDTEELEEDGAA